MHVSQFQASLQRVRCNKHQGMNGHRLALVLFLPPPPPFLCEVAESNGECVSKDSRGPAAPTPVRWALTHQFLGVPFLDFRVFLQEKQKQGGDCGSDPAIPFTETPRGQGQAPHQDPKSFHTPLPSSMDTGQETAP